MSSFILALLCLATGLEAASDVKVSFTLNTADPYGNPITQSRYYYLYRPDNLPKTTAVPMVLIMEASPNSGGAGFFHRKADQAGFIVVSCSFSGNSSGTPGTGWAADDPRIVGYEDFDYISEVIRRVRASDNADDAFIAGLSKGGHISLAYACVRPEMLKAAASLDEFMGLTSNLPSAPLPVMFVQGTLDTNVPYTMVKDTADAWRAANGLVNAEPVTTVESSPMIPNMVSQATWRDDASGLQVAFVTVIGGTHQYPLPNVTTGYDCTDGLWAFFSQFVTPKQDGVKIVSQPVNQVQLRGYPASFHVAAVGLGPITYQWQKDGVDIPDAISNTLTVLETVAASYRVVVSNDLGSVTSAAATLTLKDLAPGPAIVAQPEDQGVMSGQPVTFNVVVDDPGPVRHQWRKNGVNIVGETSDTLALNAITSDSGASFSVQLVGSSGTTVSRRAMLTVSTPDGAPVVLTNPARYRSLQNQQGTFSVSAWSASPMSYQWQKGTLTTNMADIPGAISATYTTPPTAIADHLTLMRCNISNDAGSVTTADEMLFVTAAPVAPNSIDSLITATGQVGRPFSYTLLGSGGTQPLQFSASPLPDGLSFDPATAVISGVPTSVGTSTITVDVANAVGHKSATLTLNVQADPVVQNIEDWRQANFGASARNPAVAGDDADPDGDGVSNLEEFLAGTNPLDANSVPPLPARRREP